MHFKGKARRICGPLLPYVAAMENQQVIWEEMMIDDNKEREKKIRTTILDVIIKESVWIVSYLGLFEIFLL